MQVAWLWYVSIIRVSRRELDIGEVYSPIAVKCSATRTFRRLVPHLQDPSRRMNLLVCTIGDPAKLAPAIRNEIDKTVAVYGVSTLESRLAQGTAQPRCKTWLLTLFSSLALLLAAVGIYGLIQHSVVLRTPRSALG